MRCNARAIMMVTLLGVVVPGTLSGQTEIPGFPVSINGSQRVCLGDFTGDGLPDILGGGGGQEWGVIQGTGLPAPGWTLVHDGTWETSAPFQVPTVGDITGDGSPEILFGMAANLGGIIPGVDWGIMFARDPEGVLLPGWPVPVSRPGPTLYDNTPICLGDLDGDDDFEVIWGTQEYLGSSLYELGLEALQGDGTSVSGFPMTIVFPPFYDPFTVERNCMAAGDLDGDGKDEVVLGFGAGSNANGSPSFVASPIVVIDDNGTQLWSVSLPALGAQVYDINLADLDGDELPDLLVTGSNTAFFFDGLGQQIAPWLLLPNIGRNPQAVGDVDGDGDVELVCGGWGHLRIVHPMSGEVQEFVAPEPYYHFGCPSIGDVDGDGDTEIVVWGLTDRASWWLDEYHLFILDADLEIESFPLYAVPYQAGACSTAALGDIDGNGTMEVSFEVGYEIRAVSIDNPTGGLLTVQWQGLGGEPTNSCWYERALAVNPPRFLRGDVDGGGTLGLNDAILMLIAMFGGGTSDCPAVFDVNGDGNIHVNDPILLLGYMFGTGPPPVSPGWPTCDVVPDLAAPCTRWNCP